MKEIHEHPGRALLICALALGMSGCELLHYFEPPPPSRCDVVGAM